MLRAMDIHTCSDLLTHRALLRALFSKLSFEFFMSAALGLGSTSHALPLREGEAGRKGISCERTFRPLSSRTQLEAKVRGRCTLVRAGHTVCSATSWCSTWLRIWQQRG